MIDQKERPAPKTCEHPKRKIIVSRTEVPQKYKYLYQATCSVCNKVLIEYEYPKSSAR